MKKKIRDEITSLVLCIIFVLTPYIQVNAEVISSPKENRIAETVTIQVPNLSGTPNEIVASIITISQENRWEIVLTDDEIDLLAKIVWLEARGETSEGQEAVVEVVFNRMASPLFPDTVYDVLSQKEPRQFSTWPHLDKASPTDKEYASIYEVLAGNTELLREDTYYFSRKMQTDNLDVEIGRHYFCY